MSSAGTEDTVRDDEGDIRDGKSKGEGQALSTVGAGDSIDEVVGEIANGKDQAEPPAEADITVPGFAVNASETCGVKNAGAAEGEEAGGED